MIWRLTGLHSKLQACCIMKPSKATTRKSQDILGLYSEFKASLRYVRPWVQKEEKGKKGQIPLFVNRLLPSRSTVTHSGLPGPLQRHHARLWGAQLGLYGSAEQLPASGRVCRPQGPPALEGRGSV